MNHFGGSTAVNVDVISGTTDAYFNTVKSKNLTANLPVVSNADKILISSLLNISDVSGLQDELDALADPQDSIAFNNLASPPTGETDQSKISFNTSGDMLMTQEDNTNTRFVMDQVDGEPTFCRMGVDAFENHEGGGTNLIGIGHQAGINIDGINNIIMGHDSLTTDVALPLSQIGNVAVGNNIEYKNSDCLVTNSVLVGHDITCGDFNTSNVVAVGKGINTEGQQNVSIIGKDMTDLYSESTVCDLGKKRKFQNCFLDKAVVMDTSTAETPDADNIAMSFNGTNPEMMTSDGTSRKMILESDTCEQSNNSIGKQANINCSGTNNVSVGNQTLRDLGEEGTYDIGNTAVGHFSQRAVKSGRYNTTVGASAMDQAQTADSAQYNSVFGANTQCTDGEYNTVLGYAAKCNNTVRAIAIGANVNNAVSNTTKIGNTDQTDIYSTSTTCDLGYNVPFRNIHTSGYNEIKNISAPANAASGTVRLYSDTDGLLNTIDATGDIRRVTNTNFAMLSDTFSSYDNPAGIHYADGYYYADVNAAPLSGSGTAGIPWGSANVPHNAHAFIVSDGTCTGIDVDIYIRGTKIDEATGVRTVNFEETLSLDFGSSVSGEYFESTTKFVGVFEVWTGKVGNAATDGNINYGYAKYQDVGDQDFSIVVAEVVGLGGANDSNFSLQLLKHSQTGWTYSAAAFSPGDGVVVDFTAETSPENDIANNVPFAFKRVGNLGTILGSQNEGVLWRITTGAIKTITYMNLKLGVVTDT